MGPDVDDAEAGAVDRDADAVARTVTEPGSRELAAVVARFGSAVLARDGRLDRSALARIHGATIGCPITTGLFARIAAGAAAEIGA